MHDPLFRTKEISQMQNSDKKKYVIANFLLLSTKLKTDKCTIQRKNAFMMYSSDIGPSRTVARERERTSQVRSRSFSFVLPSHTLNENKLLSFALQTDKRKTKHSPNSHIRTKGNHGQYTVKSQPFIHVAMFRSSNTKFSLDSYFKLRRKMEIEKHEDDFFYDTSIGLLTQSPEKRKRKKWASWERNLKMYRCPMDIN